MATKNYVLDTNVLLHDPHAIYRFDDNNVVIPIYVLEEIDTFKKDLSELGRNAREVTRLLDSHRANGGLSHPVKLDNGGTIRVALAARPMPDVLRVSMRADNFILAVAIEVRDGDPDTRTVLVTKDVNLRVRGDALGLQTVDYDAEHISIDELYLGATEVEVDGDQINAFYAEGMLPAPGALIANQFVLL